MAETYIRKNGIREQRIGAELMLIDEETDKVHVLNRTSAFVWSCLDGTSDSETIGLKLAGAFEIGDKDIHTVVAKALALLSEKGLATRSSTV